jgi:hypothetical protein
MCVLERISYTVSPLASPIVAEFGRTLFCRGKAAADCYQSAACFLGLGGRARRR